MNDSSRANSIDCFMKELAESWIRERKVMFRCANDLDVMMQGCLDEVLKALVERCAFPSYSVGIMETDGE